MSDNTIYLNYDFSSNNAKLFQGIYTAHFHGSTFIIGAKMTPHYKNKRITSVDAIFRSETMGGIINFAIHSVDDVTKFDPGEGVHTLLIKVNLLEDDDADLGVQKIRFDGSFDPSKHILRIQITDEEIENWVDGGIRLCKDPLSTQANDYRSCNILVNPGD